MHLACLNVDVEEAQLLFTMSSSLVHSLDMHKKSTALAAEEDAKSKGLSGASMQRYVSNAVDALVRAEHNKCTNDYLLPGSPYQMLDINVPNNEGDTPLHLAAFLGSQPMVEFLISVGADASLLNNGELTALERARLAQRDKVYEPLREAQYRIQGLILQAERGVRVSCAKEELRVC